MLWAKKREGGCRWQWWWWSVKAAQQGKVWAVSNTCWQGFQAYRATDVKIPEAGTCLEHSGSRIEARVAGERVSRGSGKRWGQWGSLKIVTSSKDFGFYSERGPIHPSVRPSVHPSVCPFIHPSVYIHRKLTEHWFAKSEEGICSFLQ